MTLKYIISVGLNLPMHPKRDREGEPNKPDLPHPAPNSNIDN